MSTLAQFIYQHLSPSQWWTRSQPPTLPWVNLDQSIPLVNQANLLKPHFPSINPYLHVPHSFLPNIHWQVPLHYSPLGQMENPEDTNCIHHDITNNFPYYPEEFYVSSVLPTCTPKELCSFQQHCWNLYLQWSQATYMVEHDLHQAQRHFSSPLHFQGLLWKHTMTIAKEGITENYYWICQHTHVNKPNQAILKPGYTVFYPWASIS